MLCGEVGGWGRDPFSRNLMSPTPRRKWYLTTGRLIKWSSTPSPKYSQYIFLGLDPSPPPLVMRRLLCTYKCMLHIPAYAAIIYIHIYMHMCVCVCMCGMYVCIYIYICIYVYMCICIYVYTYMYIYILYIYIYTYIHTYVADLNSSWLTWTYTHIHAVCVCVCVVNHEIR